MRYPLSTFRAAISEPGRLIPFLLLIVLATGCDTESLLKTEPTDRANRAIAILGAEAQVIAHLDMPALLADAENLEHVVPESSLPEGGLDQFLQSWTLATGLDVRNDVSSVVLGAFARSGEEPQTGLVAYADIDIESLVDRLNTNAEEFSLVREGTTSVIYAENGVHAVGAYLEEGIVLGASDEARLFDMVSRAEAGDTSFFTSEALVSRVQHQSAWVVVSDVQSLLGHSELPQDMELATTLLSTLDRIVVGFEADNEALQISAFLAPRADVTASDLADLLRGALAITRAQSADEDMMHLLDQIDVDHADGVVEVDIVLDEASLQVIFADLGEAFKADVFEPRHPGVH